MAQDTNQLLQERGKTHGDYRVHARITQQIKDLYRSMSGWERLTPSMREALEMNAHKVGRILAGNPAFSDHWHDIAGYSKLVANELDGLNPDGSPGRPIFEKIEELSKYLDEQIEQKEAA